ncbi:MAG: TIGR00282 family metallophosphoesterase [Hyphomicrobiales bacterium]|nr:TIGR00282 family metallophosphoesterase [Hyphomicrobiales bacterium]MCY4048779.1 TIGR00282 family metallophosphoesterase [Hyphomicrobiales bacterium]MCY4052333.1 TIGR00282 family metallophosphoesterase [Hyphomicrobiales bacterium]
MRILFLGDIMGRSGRSLLLQRIAGLRKRFGAEFVIANGENAAGGFGITEKISESLLDAGVDIVTTGNHVWDRREVIPYMDREPRVLRPANFPQGTPGVGYHLLETPTGKRVLTINLMGRVFMEILDNPFQVMEEILKDHNLGRNCDAIVVDFHAEATAEKMAMGHFCDSHVSLVVGTHSHVPTADAQILPGGTAYQTDAGMCGDYNSVIGMNIEEPLQRFTRSMSSGSFTPALGEATLCGVLVETDESTGLAVRIAPLRVGANLAESIPLWEQPEQPRREV